MTYLEKLLDGAPVEWRSLGEVAELKRGTSITQKTSTEGIYPVISGGQQPAYYVDQFNRTGETITVAGSGAYAGFLQYWNEPIFVCDAFSIKPDPSRLLTRFVYFFLLNQQKKLHAMKQGGAVPHVYVKFVAPLLIPLPPLAVQQQIVEILDKFTALEAELEARGRQFRYYRNKLLRFGTTDPNVQWCRLGEVAELKRGRVISKKYIEENTGQYPVYSSQTLNNGEIGRINTFDFDCETVTWTTDGVYAGTVFYRKGKFSITNVCGMITILDTQRLNYQFLSFWLSIEARKHVNPSMGNAKVMNHQMAKILIPLPPLAVQEQIVAVLDKFHTLVHSLSEGLPAEIALRRQQYQYYRRRLLDFPKP